MSKATEKISDMLSELYPDLHFSDEWIKRERENHGKYGTSEVWWSMRARKPRTFLTYDIVYFYGHSPMPECAKYGIVVTYENYSYYVNSKPTPELLTNKAV